MSKPRYLEGINVDTSTEPAGEVTEAYQTAAGNVFYQAKDKNGDIYHVKQGKGRIKQQSYAAGKTHTVPAEVERGNLSEEEIQQTNYGEGGYFQNKKHIEHPVAAEIKANENQFRGFISTVQASQRPDNRYEQVEFFQEFAAEMSEADSLAERAQIREQFGLINTP